MQVNTEEFIPVKKVDDIPEGEIVSAKVQGVDLMIAWLNGDIVVAHAKCPHEGTDLSTGDFDGETVKCPGHGRVFNMRTGERVDRPGSCITQFESRVIDNQVTIDQESLSQFLSKERNRSPHIPHSDHSIKITDLPAPPGLPLLGNMFQIDMSRMHLIFREWSKVYGDMFRIKLPQGDALVISDPKIIQDILRDRPDTFRRIKTFAPFFEEIDGHGVFSQEGEIWERHRRIIVPALNLTHIQDFDSILNMYVKRLYNKWLEASQNRTVMDLDSELTSFTGDVAINSTLGQDLNLLEGKSNPLRDAMEVIFERIVARALAPFPYWRYIKLPKDRALDRALIVVNKALKDLIQQARDHMQDKNNSEAKNFLDALVSWKDSDGRVLSEHDIHGNAMTMIAAGNDTTGHTLSWIIYNMATHPAIQQKMQQEADNMLGESKWLESKEQFRHGSYIDAVIREAMRIKPVAPLQPHEPNMDVEIDNVFVPKGTILFIATDQPSVDDRNFSDAQSFEPERWSGKIPEGYHHKPKASMSFGYGPRLCPGRMLALTQIASVTTMVARNFNVSLIKNHPPVEEAFAFTMHPTKIRVQFAARNQTQYLGTANSKGI